jgi:hypothetical protein
VTFPGNGPNSDIHTILYTVILKKKEVPERRSGLRRSEKKLPARSVTKIPLTLYANEEMLEDVGTSVTRVHFIGGRRKRGPPS